MTVVQLPVAARAAAVPPRPPREAIAFQSDVTAIELRPIPLWARSTVLLIVMALAIALTWAAFARLDKVVTAQGRLVTTSPKLVVGPLEVATVRAIPVRPGDVVHKGGLLAELDPTFVAADVAMLEHKRSSLEAQLARLRAEFENGPFGPTSFGEAGRLQAAVFEQRVRERDARRVTFDREAGQVQASLAARVE
jgi:hemolysin D